MPKLIKILKYSLFTLVLLVAALALIWFLGPTPDFDDVTPELQAISFPVEELNDYVLSSEAKVTGIKPENQSRIIWADSIRQTEYALVYLHGFSAGPMEGAPLHQEVARRYGMNLYLPRLSQHGLSDKDAFLNLTPKGLVESAKEALVIGQKIGKKVILMSCSTGGTLGIYLTSNHPNVYAHLMYSPNIDLFDPTTDLMTGPWGLQILKQVLGEYREPEPHKASVPDSIRLKKDLYWTSYYKVEGLVALQSLLDKTMTEEVFRSIEQPYFLGYYYKDDAAQDSVVSIDAMKKFDQLTATPEEKKRVVAFTEAQSHVINSDLTSKQYEDVKIETLKYLDEILGIKPLAKYK